MGEDRVGQTLKTISPLYESKQIEVNKSLNLCLPITNKLEPKCANLGARAPRRSERTV